MFLQSLNLTHSDEIIIPVNSYPTAFPTLISKAKVVLTECNKNGLMNIGKLKKLVTNKTKVIIPVRLYD